MENSSPVNKQSKTWRAIDHEKVLVVAIACIAILVIAVPLSKILPPGVDWHLMFRPAAMAVLEGKSPYSVEGFFNAPWTVLVLIPFALLSEEMGRAMLFLLSFIAYSLVAYRIGAKHITVIAFMISPPVLHGLLNSNIDWLALLGFILPPQIGLFFVAIKPQVGIGIMIFWLFQSWKTGGWRETIRIFFPFTLAILASLLIFGLWPLRFNQTISFSWNASFWPASIPLGLVLLVHAIRTMDIRYAMPAGPCLSPYVIFHSWVGALLPLLTLKWETIIAVIGLWLVVLLRS